MFICKQIEVVPFLTFQSTNSFTQICRIFNKHLQFSPWTVFTNIFKIQRAISFPIASFPVHLNILTVMLFKINKIVSFYSAQSVQAGDVILFSLLTATAFPEIAAKMVFKTVLIGVMKAYVNRRLLKLLFWKN